MEQNSFEELMLELKKTVDILEKGEQSLEQSMKSYESGIRLVRDLEEKLKSMEGRMEEILADGTVKEMDVTIATELGHDRT